MMIKRDFEDIGMFNENLFLFSDDDLCRKFKLKKKSAVEVKCNCMSYMVKQSKKCYKKIFLKEYYFTYETKLLLYKIAI